MIISFSIPGLPQQQGTKVKNRYGAMYDENKKLPAWRADAISCAVRARTEAGETTILGPVLVRARFTFPRPKSHYGTGRNAGVLKDSAPYWHSSKPDGDKVARALGDVLTMARVIRDDAQIARWEAEKIYGELPGVEVRISTLSKPWGAFPAASASQLAELAEVASQLDELVTA
jgi:crossover junction endodeoxyribonuclease RusA